MVGHVPTSLDLVEVVAVLPQEVWTHQDIGRVGMLAHREDGIVLAEE